MEIFSRRPDQASNVTPSSSNDKYDVSSSPTLPIYLQQSDQITVPALSASRKRRQSSASLESHLNRFIQPKTSSSPAVTTLAHAESEKPDIKRTKTMVVSKDLLSEDEKRLNHIASEQKRRNTIRSGFKELTEIIPTLKNINNSKSTILFKAVEYIKHLDRRNRGLREKLSSLHLRMNVATRNQERSRASRKLVSRSMHHQHSFIQGSSSENARHSDDLRHLPANTISALMAHKNQQRQLEMLQEQLRAQQQLLVKHNIQPYASSPGYHSISIPNHENRHSSALALVVPQDEEDPSWHSSF
jgi:hypothetical protein